MPFGMCASQLSMGRPKMRNGMPRRRKCAAIDSPYGPAPTIAVFSIVLRKRPSSGGKLLADPTQMRKYWLILPCPTLVTRERKRHAPGIKVTRREASRRRRESRNSFCNNQISPLFPKLSALWDRLRLARSTVEWRTAEDSSRPPYNFVPKHQAKV